MDSEFDIMNKPYFKLTFFVFLIMLSISMSGCSSFAKKSGSACGIPLEDNAVEFEKLWTDQKLKDAFCEYWTLRYSGSLQETYELEAPLFRDKVSIEKYEIYVKRTVNNDLVKLVVNGVGGDPDAISHVDSNFYLKTKSGEEISSSIRDKWIQVDGKWFHAMRDPFFFPISYE